MRFLYILFSCVSLLTTYSQTPDTVKADSTIFFDHLVVPTFPGGSTELKRYLKNNFKWVQGQATIGGSVVVEFFVEVDGTITEAKVVRNLCESCDKEALRLVNGMPKWKPGSEFDKTRRMKMVIQVLFGD